MSDMHSTMIEVDECNRELDIVQDAIFEFAKSAPHKMRLYKEAWAKAYLTATGPVKGREAVADGVTAQLYEDAHIEKSLEKATIINMGRLEKKLMSKMGKLASFRSVANALHA